MVSKPRKICPYPKLVLDAPYLCDDFYLNLVDWSSLNSVAVALRNKVYIWNGNTTQVSELVDLGMPPNSPH